MTNAGRIAKNRKEITIRQVALIGVLGALAAIIMMFSFPLPFAPSFYKADLSEVVVMVGAFTLGPVSGCIIELIKILVSFLLNGTTTVGVGEIANFAIGCSYILPAAIIYRRQKSFRYAIIGLGVGTLSMAIIGALLNYFVLLPAFSYFYQMPIQSFVDMGNKLNPNVNTVATLVLLATTPFNLVKGLISSLIAALIYPKLGAILHK